jgi:NADPH:quinone reductase-like Zn-dependent oxidoreductase
MHAIIIDHYGGPEVLVPAELPDPEPGEGEVLIRVQAFGLNHAECYFRSGAWGEVARVTGIEVAGSVVEDRTGALAPGTRVVALLGGMGRTRDGSYGELVTVPAGNVTAVDADLSWAQLAAVPQVYATAWSALYRNLDLRPGQRLLVRGATSAVGQATVQLGVLASAIVVATSRRPERMAALRELGAADAVIDDGHLAEKVGPVDAVVDLVGNSTLRDSLRCVRAGGRVVQVGFLGGLAPIEAFNPLMDLPTGVHLSFYASAFVLGTADYPMGEIPLKEIYERVAAGQLMAAPVRTYGVDEIVAAHQLMESGDAGGKLVVDRTRPSS